MIQKRDLIIAIVTIYTILIMLFIMVRDKPDYHSVCSYEETCVRFCCYNKNSCKEKLLRTSFNKSLITSKEWKNGLRTGSLNETEEDENIKILYGAPTCSLKLFSTTSEKGWKFEYVRPFIANNYNRQAQSIYV